MDMDKNAFLDVLIQSFSILKEILKQNRYDRKLLQRRGLTDAGKRRILRRIRNRQKRGAILVDKLCLKTSEIKGIMDAEERILARMENLMSEAEELRSSKSVRARFSTPSTKGSRMSELADLLGSRCSDSTTTINLTGSIFGAVPRM